MSRSIQGPHLNNLIRTQASNATCQVSRSLISWFGEDFKGFYNIWVWWPSWSCDPFLCIKSNSYAP